MISWQCLTLLHSELSYGVLAVLSAVGLPNPIAPQTLVWSSECNRVTVKWYASRRDNIIIFIFASLLSRFGADVAVPHSVPAGCINLFNYKPRFDSTQLPSVLI